MTNDTLPSYENLMNQDEVYEIIPGYAAPPTEDTNGKIKNYAENINPPDHDIVVFDLKYISKRHDTLCLREGFSKYSKNSLIVFDSGDEEIYNVKVKMNRNILFDRDNVPIFNAYTEANDYRNIRFFEGKKNNGYIGSLRTRDNIYAKHRTCTATFTNKVSNSREELKIIYDWSIGYYGIYCNKDLPNETMIGKFKKHDINRTIMLEFAPRVDTMFILAIAVGFLKYK